VFIKILPKKDGTFLLPMFRVHPKCVGPVARTGIDILIVIASRSPEPLLRMWKGTSEGPVLNLVEGVAKQSATSIL